MRMYIIAALAIPLGIGGCANPSVGTVKDTRVLPSYSAPIPAQKQTAIPKDPDAYRYTDPGRSYSLTLKDADLRDVLMLLSKESGVSIVAERGLRGRVQVEAKNKKLGEMLYTILKPLGYTASVENGMILVGRPKLTTRTFQMNYLKDTRNSSSNMNVSGFAAGGSGSVSVSTTGKSDFWGAIENSLEMLVFGTSGMGRRSDGGYIRGEAEKKQVAESRASGSAQTTNRGNIQSNINNISSYAKSKSNYDELNSSTIQSTEVDDPMLLNSQINENQLKQLVVNEIAGIIQITDYSENLDKIASFLVDVEEGSKRQVLIQAHIMEVGLKDSFSMGINWDNILASTVNPTTLQQMFTPTKSGSNVFKATKEIGNVKVMLEALKEQGNVNMLSSPKITALNNQKAVIKLTTKEVSWIYSKSTATSSNGSDTFTWTPQIDEVGIFLDVTPQIGQDGSIIMQIHPSISEVKGTSTAPENQGSKPIIDVREIDTMVDAKAGETIVIAGLISDKLNETKRSVPLLGDIPYLGNLFSYSSQARAKSELVIMMTPYILNSKTIDEIRMDHEKRMQNIGGDFHLINNLGSMITEKSSRDWIMRSEPNRVQPVPSAEVAPVVAPAPPAVTPAAQKTTPRPEVKNTSEPAQVIAVTSPETVRHMEQQQATIVRLEQEVSAAKERLSRERLENEIKSSEEKRAADALRQAQLKKIEELQNIPVVGTIVTPAKTVVQAPPSDNSPASAGVQTTSVTTDREQTLYRSAVTAYKIGDCSESIKTFDAFTKAFPGSPFSSDAAYYRKDCSDRLSAATSR